MEEVDGAVDLMRDGDDESGPDDVGKRGIGGLLLDGPQDGFEFGRGEAGEEDLRGVVEGEGVEDGEELALHNILFEVIIILATFFYISSVPTGEFCWQTSENNKEQAYWESYQYFVIVLDLLIYY